VNELKRVLLSVLFAVLVLSACHSSQLSFSENENVHQNLEAHIDPDLQLQLINDGTKGAYVVFHSKGDIEADLDPQDNIVNILFDERNPQADNVKRNVYYLTTDSKQDTINVPVNGEKMPFDVVTGI
jgi:hypothetical protein